MDALAALRLQLEWGADEALEDVPLDRLRAPAPVRPHADAAAVPSGLDRAAMDPAGVDAAGNGAVHASAPTEPAYRLSSQPSPNRSTPAEQAHRAAAAARTLPALRDAITGFGGCALRDTATHAVLFEGEPGGLLLVGEAPSADDDRAGRPFTGRQGAYLDKMLASVGLDRRSLLLTPLIPWRPPGDRPPSPTELAVCLPFLLRLLVLARPRLALLLGSLASRTLLGDVTPGRVRRGKWTELALPEAPPVAVLPSHSVASLLTRPILRRDAWADLRALRRSADGLITEK